MHLSNFEKLPQEVRDCIYSLLFARDETLVPGVHYTYDPIKMPFPWLAKLFENPFPSLAILQVNRRIATDAAMVLFEQNSYQIRMPPFHVGESVSRHGCTVTRFGEQFEEDNHSCRQFYCLRGHKQRHIAQRFLQRYGHQIQHAHLTPDTYDLIRHLGFPEIDRMGESFMGSCLYDLYNNHKEYDSRLTCERLYIGWRWEGYALHSIAATGLRSVTLDLAHLWFGVTSINAEDRQNYWKEAFGSVMQTLFQGLKLRQVTFLQHWTEGDGSVVWMNPKFDTEQGSGWVDSLTVLNLPWQKDNSIFLAVLKQAGQRPAVSSTYGSSSPDNLALSNIREHDEPNTWLK